MNVNDIVTIIFSSTLLATIITSVFNLFTSRRKDSMENIIKERKTWRDEMRKISQSISKSENITELLIAISALKVRINAYGLAYNSIFADSHIWEQISMVESVESLSPKELNNKKRVFVTQISCLLKYDWERAKVEIKGNTQTKVVIISLIISFLLYSFRWFYNYSVGSGKIMNFLSYTTVYIIFSALAILIINLADKWRNAAHYYTYILSSTLAIAILYLFMYASLPSASPFDIFDNIIRFAPCIILIYSVETKLLAYKRNVSFFIMASTLSCGATKIHKKYRIFFGRESYTNLLTGEKITFCDFEEIIALRNTNFSNIQEEGNEEPINQQYTHGVEEQQELT